MWKELIWCQEAINSEPRDSQSDEPCLYHTALFIMTRIRIGLRDPPPPISESELHTRGRGKADQPDDQGASFCVSLLPVQLHYKRQVAALSPELRQISPSNLCQDPST